MSAERTEPSSRMEGCMENYEVAEDSSSWALIQQAKATRSVCLSRLRFSQREKNLFTENF